MGSMVPCFDCFSQDGKIDYGDFPPYAYPCCDCASKKYKGKKICTINGIDFLYGGWNQNGWHLVYTFDENFHVGDDESVLPTEKDCQRIFKNYYEE